jgi:hypothetical protein
LTELTACGGTVRTAMPPRRVEAMSYSGAGAVKKRARVAERRIARPGGGLGCAGDRFHAQVGNVGMPGWFPGTPKNVCPAGQNCLRLASAAQKPSVRQRRQRVTLPWPQSGSGCDPIFGRVRERDDRRHKCGAGRDNAPGNQNSGNPNPRTDLAQQYISWHFENEVAEKENAAAKSIDRPIRIPAPCSW